MRVQRHRVGELDPGEQPLAAFGQRREPAVGRVNVQPRPSFLTDLGQLGERVHGAGIGGACAGHHEERSSARAQVGFHRVEEGVGAHPETFVGGQDPQLLGLEAEDAGRPRYRGVRLVGDVGHDLI